VAFELGAQYDHGVLVKEKFNKYIEYLLGCGKHTLAIRAADDAQQHLQAAMMLKTFAEKLISEKVNELDVMFYQVYLIKLGFDFQLFS
jgi:hypothetical protein